MYSCTYLSHYLIIALICGQQLCAHTPHAFTNTALLTKICVPSDKEFLSQDCMSWRSTGLCRGSVPYP